MNKTAATRNPVEWFAETVGPLFNRQDDAERLRARTASVLALPKPRGIDVTDLRDAVAQGFADFAEFRTDVIFLCIMYPVAGLVLSRIVVGYGLFQLAFPLAAGFALLGPVLATGLYEMSRQRALGRPVTWSTAFDAFGSPAIGSIVMLGLYLLAVFAAWIGAADLIYASTVGLDHPASPAAFAGALLSTAHGHALIVLGVGVGFLFAAFVLSITAISIPALLDRDIGAAEAMALSVRTVRRNPVTMALWGCTIAAGLILGSLPLLMGLAVTVPVLGHATWHLYRRLMPG